MKHLAIAVTAKLLALAAPAHAQEAPQPGHYDISAQAGPTTVDDTSEATDLRFVEDRHQRMTVPVTLSGTGPYRFLVDTGADRTVISRDLARRLSLPVEGLANVHNVAGIAQVGTATVPELDFDVRSIRNVEAALLDASDMGADGILGLDTLRSHRILFDFEEQTLTVVPAKRQVYEDEEGTITITGRRRGGRLILTKARAEDTKVVVVVDTGSEVTIGNNALRERLARSKLLAPDGTAELVSVTGQVIHGDSMLVKKLEIGGVVLGDVRIVFADSHAFRQLGLDDKPALLLGMNALRAFDKVSIDFARKKLRVVLPETGALDGAVLAAARSDWRAGQSFPK